MPFAWGDHANDCISAAAAAVVAQGGEDHLAALRWSTEEEAETAIEAAGGVETALTAKLGEPIAPAFAQRGDIGAIMAGNRMILVVVEGDTLAGPGPERLRRLPRAMLIRAWRAL